MALLKFVDAHDCRNEILEQWIALQSKAARISGSSEGGAGAIDNPYSKCLILMQSLLGEDKHLVFLKGCKELENVFAHKAFMVLITLSTRPS